MPFNLDLDLVWLHKLIVPQSVHDLIFLGIPDVKSNLVEQEEGRVRKNERWKDVKVKLFCDDVVLEKLGQVL